MTYLDTNAVIWLYDGQLEKFSEKALTLIKKEEVKISPMVELEIEYLYKIDRITASAEEIINFIRFELAISYCDKPMRAVTNYAKHLQWTRDPFDRIITAQAALNSDYLITRDKTILKHYQHAVA